MLRDHTHNDMSRLLRTADQARRHLGPAESGARLTGQLLGGGVLEAADAAGLRRSFQAQLNNSASLAALYLGRPDGSFVMVKRDPQGSYAKTIRTVGGARLVRTEVGPGAALAGPRPAGPGSAEMALAEALYHADQATLTARPRARTAPGWRRAEPARPSPPGSWSSAQHEPGAQASANSLTHGHSGRRHDPG